MLFPLSLFLPLVPSRASPQLTVAKPMVHLATLMQNAIVCSCCRGGREEKKVWAFFLSVSFFLCLQGRLDFFLDAITFLRFSSDSSSIFFDSRRTMSGARAVSSQHQEAPRRSRSIEKGDSGGEQKQKRLTAAAASSPLSLSPLFPAQRPPPSVQTLFQLATRPPSPPSPCPSSRPSASLWPASQPGRALPCGPDTSGGVTTSEPVGWRFRRTEAASSLGPSGRFPTAPRSRAPSRPPRSCSLASCRRSASRSACSGKRGASWRPWPSRLRCSSPRRCACFKFSWRSSAPRRSRGRSGCGGSPGPTSGGASGSVSGREMTREGQGKKGREGKRGRERERERGFSSFFFATSFCPLEPLTRRRLFYSITHTHTQNTRNFSCGRPLGSCRVPGLLRPVQKEETRVFRSGNAARGRGRGRSDSNSSSSCCCPLCSLCSLCSSFTSCPRPLLGRRQQQHKEHRDAVHRGHGSGGRGGARGVLDFDLEARERLRRLSRPRGLPLLQTAQVPRHGGEGRGELKREQEGQQQGRGRWRERERERERRCRGGLFLGSHRSCVRLWYRRSAKRLRRRQRRPRSQRRPACDPPRGSSTRVPAEPAETGVLRRGAEVDVEGGFGPERGAGGRRRRRRRRTSVTRELSLRRPRGSIPLSFICLFSSFLSFLAGLLQALSSSSVGAGA